MKTPEEVKKGIECCVMGSRCGCHCPFYDKNHNVYQCTGNLVDDALAYIAQLEETISLMKIQMRGDCGCCKHGRDGDMRRCNECLSSREYHPLWEYEGLPEVKTDEQSEMSVLR